MSLLALADDPYRTTSGEPGTVIPGRSRTRWVLAGAMLVTVAAIGAVLVPGGDDSQLDTTPGDEVAAADAPATTETTPLLDYISSTTTPPSASASTETTAPGPTANALVASAGGSVSTTASSTVSSPGAGATVTTTNGTTVKGTTATTVKGTSKTTASTATASTTAPTTAEPTTAPPATTAPGCWTLVTEENFDGTRVNGDTWVEYNGDGHDNHGRLSSSALSVSGGLLTITAQMENGTLVSGGLGARHSQMYGRYEARVRTDQDPSETMSGQVLTWPQSGDPAAGGENAFYLTGQTPGDRHQFVSSILAPGGDDRTVHGTSASEWHTMAMEWQADKIVISRDGQVVRTLTEDATNRIPDAAHFVAIQLDAWNDTLPGPVTMQVDYVKVYAAC